jgi:hypothetical protein
MSLAFHQYIPAVRKDYGVIGASGEYYSNVAVGLKRKSTNCSAIAGTEECRAS